MRFVTFWDAILFSIYSILVIFAVLALLGFIIYLFKFFFYKKTKSTAVKVEEIALVKEKKIKEVKNKKKFAAIAASINMYLQSKAEASKKIFIPSILSKSEFSNIWKLKGFLVKSVSPIKERRWKNG